MKITPLTLLSALLASANIVIAQNDDRFNYRATAGLDFGPNDWDDVRCGDLDECIGWPFDGWSQRRGWGLGGNNCEWCPDAGSSRCGAHRQSPIDFDRNVGLPGDSNFEDPPDWHWMKYERRNCIWEDIINNPQARTPNQFRIERHALQMLQPVGDDNMPKCPAGFGGGTFPRVDYSKGFKWWWLTNTDIKIPSEHFQEGKQYDAEVQLAHGYSLAPTDEGGRDNREMGKIGIFMNVYDNVEPWPYLDKLICQWRKLEDETREACQLGSVTPAYAGCWAYSRPGPAATPAGTVRQRNLRSTANVTTAKEPMNEFEFIRSIKLDPTNFGQDPEYTVADFEQDIKDYNDDYERQYHTNATQEGGHRFLINYDHVLYHPYEWMFKAGTEYYFRYEGTQTGPPCFETVHWRFLKDPIRIHQRQLDELSRLLAQRIAPVDSEFNACLIDTAGKPRNDGSGFVDVNRPLQYMSGPHNQLFTECKDWGSKQRGDKSWCQIDNLRERFFDHPYNFEHDGF